MEFAVKWENVPERIFRIPETTFLKLMSSSLVVVVKYMYVNLTFADAQEVLPDIRILNDASVQGG